MEWWRGPQKEQVVDEQKGLLEGDQATDLPPKDVPYKEVPPRQEVRVG
ncbi:hypothetical protein CsSME_00042966 [Camellia sinensis var. sinensis]